ncbi:MAG TPA: hypothetical protein VGI81_16705 [Tepidisphaeraceae bacterium]|jgi:hypothetical protein
MRKPPPVLDYDSGADGRDPRPTLDRIDRVLVWVVVAIVAGILLIGLLSFL